MSKSLHEPSDDNSNTINTTPTVFLPSNTPVCPNYDKDVSLLIEGIDSLEQFFDMQLQNLTQISLVKSYSKRTNTNNESQILIKSLQETIFILKKELIDKENTIKILSKTSRLIHARYPLRTKNLAMNRFWKTILIILI